MIEAFLLYANAAVFAAICLRLIFYRQGDARHRSGVSWLAWFLIVCSGSVTIRTLCGIYSPVDWAELGIGVAMAIAVFRVRGNLAHLLSPRTATDAFLAFLKRWK